MRELVRLIPNLFLLRVFLLGALCPVLASAALAEAAEVVDTAKQSAFQEGVHYLLVHKVGVTKEKENSMTVTEFFSYGCPHCQNLEPHVLKWLEKKPADVHFKRIPTTWNPTFQLLAKAYYTADLLNLDHAVHSHIFSSIHRGRKDVRTAEGVKALLTDFGVAEAEVEKTFDSFGVDQKMRAGEQAFGSYRIVGKEPPKDRLSSVPLIVVNDRYLTSVGNAGGQDQVFELVDYLIGRVRSGQERIESHDGSDKKLKQDLSQKKKSQKDESESDKSDRRFLGLM